MAKPADPNRRRFSLELPVDLLDKIDALRAEWGIRSRGDILERLLLEIFPNSEEAETSVLAVDGNHLPEDCLSGQTSLTSTFNEQGALVLMTRGSGGDLCLDRESADPEFAFNFDVDASMAAEVRPRQSGIDLPGFVRRQSDQLKRSLQPLRQPIELAQEPLPHVGGDVLERSVASR